MNDAPENKPQEIEYGIASSELPDIEPLGHGFWGRATAELADSSSVWPGVYLVQRCGHGPWQRVISE